MSLTSLAIRACTFMALYRQTIAEDRVFESELAPIDELAKDEPKPFITISVDEATGDLERNGKSLLETVDNLTLVIELSIAGPVEVEGRDGEVTTVVTTPDSETALEWALDLLSFQIVRRLGLDPVWGELWKGFFLKLRSVNRVRGGMAEKARFAARQIAISLQPIDDPDPTSLSSPDLPWPKFLAALRAIPVAPDPAADPNLAGYPALADALEAAISADGYEPWEMVAARLGVNRETASTLGIGPMIPIETQETPIAGTVVTTGDLETVSITEVVADQAGEV